MRCRRRPRMITWADCLSRRANVRDDVGDITFVFHLLPLTSSFKRRPLVDPRVVTLKYSHVRAIRRSCERTPHVTYSVLQQRFLSFDDLSRFSGVYPPPTTTTPRHPTPQRPIRMAAWHIHSAQKDRTNSDKLCKKIDRKFYLPRRHKLNPCRKSRRLMLCQKYCFPHQIGAEQWKQIDTQNLVCPLGLSITLIS